VLQCRWVLNFTIIFAFTVFRVCIRFVQFYALLWHLENVSSMEYNVVSIFFITNKTTTNKQIDFLLQKIFINCSGEK